ncbi:hypothetical protein [Paenibacillus graminis]|uniref:hypothetical protein n=1 Tax=Paenibacillus graminis TaxID=189425 RepID=UPI0012E02580|nr:hypothetical protein [Paenibacillus graminis]
METTAEMPLWAAQPPRVPPPRSRQECRAAQPSRVPPPRSRQRQCRRAQPRPPGVFQCANPRGWMIR